MCVCVCVQEKVDALKVLGADVRLVPAVPITDPKNYNHQVRSEFKLEYWGSEFKLEYWEVRVQIIILGGQSSQGFMPCTTSHLLGFPS